MQISRIQNVIRNNFQYKNNPIKFGAINFRGQDSFECSLSDDKVVSKTYYKGGQEFASSLFMQQGNRLFIRRKNTYVPYGAHLDEHNSKGELIRRTSYSNGAKFIVNTYKNGELIQEDRYEDVFSKAHNSDRKTSVRKFSGFSKSKTRRIVPFAISRNYGKDWEKHPEIELTKEQKDKSLYIRFQAPSEEKLGEALITSTENNSVRHIHFYIDENETYSQVPKTKDDLESALLALIELRKTITSEEFDYDFYFNYKFNSELYKAIEFLSSKLNAD